jgi:hypothetical protein
VRWLFGVALIACGDNLPDPVAPQSGDRLKLHYLQYEDGALEVARDHGLYDAERGEDCWPTQFADGFTYCAPIDPAVGASRTIFTESTCTTSVLPGGGDARYGVDETLVVDRFLPSRLVLRGALTNTPTQRYELRNGYCVGPFAVPAGAGYFEVARYIERAELAGMGIVTLPIAPRIDLQVETSADGMQAPRSLQLHGLGECDLVAREGDGEVRECRPRDTIEATLYHDPACTQAVLVVPATQPMPLIAHTRDAVGCQTFHRVRERSGGELFRRTDQGCVRTVGEGPDDVQYLLADVLDLPTVSLDLSIASGRLHDLTIGDLHVSSGEWFDADRGHVCASRIIDGDRVRCVPRTTPPFPLFADERCFEYRVAQVPKRACDPPYRFADVPFREVRVHEILEPLDAPAFALDHGRCVPYTPPLDATLYRVGEAIPMSEFADAVNARGQ